MNESNIIPFPPRESVIGTRYLRVLLPCVSMSLDWMDASIFEFNQLDRTKLYPALYERKRRGLARKIEADAEEIAQLAARLAELASEFRAEQRGVVPDISPR